MKQCFDDSGQTPPPGIVNLSCKETVPDSHTPIKSSFSQMNRLAEVQEGIMTKIIARAALFALFQGITDDLSIGF